MIDILEESRVFSTRHITYEEKQAVIECLCDSIRKGKAKIVDRPENYNFLEKHKLNNHSDNLEWCSNFYNTCYKISKQVMNIDTGEKYLSIADAVRATGITHIPDVCKGKRPKAGGCRWKFIDNIIPKQNISPLKEGDVPLWQD